MNKTGCEPARFCPAHICTAALRGSGPESGWVRILCLFVAVLFCLPLDARADARCLEAQALRGNVKTVLISNGRVWSDTGAPGEGPWISGNDLTSAAIAEASRSSSIPPTFFLLPLLNLWPTTICDFDDSGRLVRSRVKVNGLTTYTTVETAYDPQGRQLLVKSRSRDPEFTYDATYEYSGNAVTERFPRKSCDYDDHRTRRFGPDYRENRRDPNKNVELSNVSLQYRTRHDGNRFGRENGKDWRPHAEAGRHGKHDRVRVIPRRLRNSRLASVSTMTRKGTGYVA